MSDMRSLRNIAKKEDKSHFKLARIITPKKNMSPKAWDEKLQSQGDYNVIIFKMVGETQGKNNKAVWE